MIDWNRWVREKWAEEQKALSVQRVQGYMSQGMSRQQAEDMVQRHYPGHLDQTRANETAAILAALETGQVRKVREVTTKKAPYPHHTPVPYSRDERFPEVLVDLGLSLVSQGHAPIDVAPHSFIPGEWSAPVPLAGLACGPLSVAALVGASGAHLWRLACQALELAEAGAADAEKAMSRKHREIEKARERAARPDVQAKRDEEARVRAKASLSKVLFASRSLVQDVSADEVLSLLKLAEKKELVKELIKWAGCNPRGFAVVKAEDVTEALDRARVLEVMKS